MEKLSKVKLKELKKLKLKKYRDLTDNFLVEGEHLINEANKSNSIISIYDLTDLSDSLKKEISSLDAPQNIIAVCKKNNIKEIVGNKLLLLDEIQDPGNLGTIIRSSLGFNIDTVILGDNTCDLYNEKVIRASQGSLFHLNIVKINLEEAINKIKGNIPIYGTNVSNGIDINDITDHDKYALVIGNEGRGLNTDISKLCDSNIYIKTNNNLESLNVAVATSIILYEFNK